MKGPTASGKTALSLKLFERLPVEIVSVDSAQIYRGLDIGTAKPDTDILGQVPHHLIDIREVQETYSAANFFQDAAKVMSEIHQRGHIPLLVGGTFLYFRAIEQGLHQLPEADPTVRARIDQRAKKEGWSSLHRELSRVDPETAKRIDENDAQRIQRALEVLYLTGKTLSSHFFKSPEGLKMHFLDLTLLPDSRDELYNRINRRFDEMMTQGLLEETQRIFNTKELARNSPAAKIVGYRQLIRFLEGDYDLATAIDRAKAASRQYAKRQLTWLRHQSAGAQCFFDQDRLQPAKIVEWVKKNLRYNRV
ncbi:MAG: tRNA (adenosine(37)-N6)-dimethylallyltransferase MiaA [Gammaproteobacteria bacterium]|nr:MAG: tRNA (adenosine(37)-N6)-dimethylallyltransferase MiaA [Gammaproteobacteria bacterium]